VYDFVLKRLVAIILRLGAMQWPAQASGIDNATGQEDVSSARDLKMNACIRKLNFAHQD
jgi:hypothetical protein